MTEQTKTRPQETLEFIMHKQTQNFSFSPPVILFEEGKWFLGVSSFERKNSIFRITNENNSFSFIVFGHWGSKPDEKTFDELNKLLEFESQISNEFHVKEIRKRRNQIRK